MVATNWRSGLKLMGLADDRLQIAEEDLASEIFPKTMGRRIVQAEEIRHSSDYDPFYIASKGGTQKQIETAKDLLDYARRFIVERREAEGL